MCDKLITVDPRTGKGAGITYTDAAAAVRHVNQYSGAAVIYFDVDEDANLPDIVPGGTFLHLLDQDVQDQVHCLTREMYKHLNSNKLEQAHRSYDAIFSLIPGKMGHMLDSYTTSWHLWIQEQPVVEELLQLLHGPDYLLLHNRASIRLGPQPSRPSKKRKADAELQRAPQRPRLVPGCETHDQHNAAPPPPPPQPAPSVDFKWHKEGTAGERGYICCLPLQGGGVGRRSFCLVGNEQENPFPAPSNAKLFDAVTDAQIRQRGLETTEIDVHIPPGKVAIILFDHHMVHGIHPAGLGVQLYLSGASRPKIKWLGHRRDDILRPRRGKPDGIHLKMHDPAMRLPIEYYDSVKLGLLYNCPDMIWPSGKPLPSHSVQGQSVGSNRDKFPNGDYSFRFRDGTVDNGPEMRARLEALDIRVPELAFELLQKWTLDPTTLTPQQLRRWGFRDD
jgi:hypothetical protein